MANSSIALLTQTLAKPARKTAEVESSLSGMTGSVNKLNATKGVGLELSAANQQFSIALSDAAAQPVAVDYASNVDPLQLVAGSDVIMPPHQEYDAYSLEPLDGKELPFFGNFLPKGAVLAELQGEIPDDLAQGNNQLFLASNALSEKSNAPASPSSSIKEDIALWLDDPELSFVESTTTLPGDLASATLLPSIDLAQISDGEVPELAINSTIASGVVLTDSSTVIAQGNKLAAGPNSLANALSELAIKIEQRGAQSDASPETAADITETADIAKSISTQVKQVDTTPLQLFPQQILEGHNRPSSLKDARFAERIAENIDSLRQLDRAAGRMGENFNGLASSLDALSLSNGKAGNSVDSFVNVLLNVDTSSQSSSSINPALDQWKAEQASRTALFEQTDVSGKNPFTRLSVPMNQTGWGENLGKQLATLMARNLDSAQIQLDPPELGPLQVKIQIHNDQVSLHFTTAHGVVKEALEGSSARLQEMFQEEGLELANLDVTDQGADQQQSKGSQNQAINPSGVRGDKNPSAEVDSSDGLLTLSSQWRQDDGKIDYFI